MQHAPDEQSQRTLPGLVETGVVFLDVTELTRSPSVAPHQVQTVQDEVIGPG